jgi:hypothetical protein
MSLGRYLRRAWGALPVWTRWVLAVYLIGFTDGTAAHVRDLARAGFHDYSGFPQVPLRVFFISLVLLDPLVVVLAALVLPAGIWLAAVVMVLDVTANTAGNWSRIQRDPAWPFTPDGLLVIIVFAVFVLATAPAMLHVTRSTASIALLCRVWHRKQGQSRHDNQAASAPVASVTTGTAVRLSSTFPAGDAPTRSMQRPA